MCYSSRVLAELLCQTRVLEPLLGCSVSPRSRQEAEWEYWGEGERVAFQRSLPVILCI